MRNIYYSALSYARAPYDWLENEGSEKTADSNMFQRLFGNGTAAALYHFLLMVGNFVLIVLLFMSLIRYALSASEPVARHQAKSAIIRWFMCIVVMNAVLAIARIALKIGGAL